jgi:hypothetical protein
MLFRTQANSVHSVALASEVIMEGQENIMGIQEEHQNLRGDGIITDV